MKKILSLLTTFIMIFPMLMPIAACNNKNKNSLPSITEQDVVNQIEFYDGSKLYLNTIKSEKKWLYLSQNVKTAIMNALHLDSTMKKFVYSIFTEDNILHTDGDTLFFKIKKTQDSTITDQITISITWSNTKLDNKNYLQSLMLINKIGIFGKLTINDNKLSTDNQTINLKSRVVQNAILTSIGIDYQLFSNIENITDNNDNLLYSGVTENLFFTLLYTNIKTALVVTWNNSDSSDELSAKIIQNQILNKSVIQVKGDNLSNNINDPITKEAILNNIGLTPLQRQYVYFDKNYMLIKNNFVSVTYKIIVNQISLNVIKNTILYEQQPFMNDDYVTTISQNNNNIYAGTISDGIWKYNNATNDFIKLANNNNSHEEIFSFLKNSNKPFLVGYFNQGISKVNNINVIPQYYGAPKYPTNIFQDNLNNIYVGSDFLGLFHLVDNSKFESYQTTNMNPTIYDTFTSTDNKLYCAVGPNKNFNKGGIWDMTKNTITEIPASIGTLSNLSVYKVQLINHKLFAATSNGLFYLNDQQTKFIHVDFLNSKLNNAQIITMTYDKLWPNILYIGTANNGLWKVDISNLNNIKFEQIITNHIQINSQITGLTISADNTMMVSLASPLYNDNPFYKGINNLGMWFYNIYN